MHRTKCRFDRPLALQLAYFFLTDGARSVMDLGCGCGDYLKVFHAAGLRVSGFDLNSHAPQLSGFLCATGDVARPLEVGGTLYDWALALEVAEHIPDFQEADFLENIYLHGSRGAIISWAHRKQGGIGHVNMRDDLEVIEIFRHLGYDHDVPASENLRQFAGLETVAGTCCGHFRENLLVFRKNIAVPSQPLSLWLPDFLSSMSHSLCEKTAFQLYSCSHCTYSTLQNVRLLEQSDPLWVLSSDVPLSVAFRLCCSEGVERCTAVVVNASTGERVLVGQVHHPRRWVPIEMTESNATHSKPSISVKVTQDDLVLSRNESDNCRPTPGDTDDLVWCISGMTPMNEASRESECVATFELLALANISDAYQCLHAGGNFMLYKFETSRFLDHEGGHVYQKYFSLVMERLQVLIGMNMFSGYVSACVPPAPFCSDSDGVELGWHLLVRDGTRIVGPLKIPRPQDFKMLARLRTSEDIQNYLGLTE